MSRFFIRPCVAVCLLFTYSNNVLAQEETQTESSPVAVSIEDPDPTPTPTPTPEPSEPPVNPTPSPEPTGTPEPDPDPTPPPTDDCFYFTNESLRPYSGENQGGKDMFIMSGRDFRRSPLYQFLQQIGRECNNEELKTYENITDSDSVYNYRRYWQRDYCVGDGLKALMYGARTQACIKNCRTHYRENEESRGGHAYSTCASECYHGETREGNYPLVVNSNGERINADPNTCEHVEKFEASSPISLIWEEGADIEDTISVTRFPVVPSKKGQWFTWKASVSTPLVVYDPTGSRHVSDASQLFGNWTFGGKSHASLRPMLSDQAAKTPTPWKHGYEALSMLDSDGSGAIEGSELDDIALWFDKNQDGESQIGEVVSAKERGVTRLFYKPDSIDPNTHDIHASLGFERIKDGEIVRGASVDWFSSPIPSKIQALSYLHTRGESTANIAPITGDEFTIHLPRENDAPTKNLSGIWKWTISEDSGLEDIPASYGLLVLDDENGVIRGTSFMELPLSPNTKGAKSIINGFQIDGKRVDDSNGMLRFRWNAVGSNSLTKTIVSLSSDGMTLHGKSAGKIDNKVTSKQSHISYIWKAKRITEY